jgi:hypothetical protein
MIDLRSRNLSMASARADDLLAHSLAYETFLVWLSWKRMDMWHSHKDERRLVIEPTAFPRSCRQNSRSLQCFILKLRRLKHPTIIDA